MNFGFAGSWLFFEAISLCKYMLDKQSYTNTHTNTSVIHTKANTQRFGFNFVAHANKHNFPARRCRSGKLESRLRDKAEADALGGCKIIVPTATVLAMNVKARGTSRFEFGC